MSVTLTDAQFEALLSRLSPGRHGSFTTCKAEFDGTKDTEVTEAFLAAVTVFKQIENISDAEALTGLPLLLKGEAAVWWQGVKKHVSTWADFKERLRHTFAPRKPAFVLFQEIVHETQDDHTTTESFVAHKRMLFAQLPEPEIPESHQLHMVYGQLKHGIRDKIPRNSVKSYDELLEAARGVEQMWNDRLDDGDKRRDEKPKTNSKMKVKCEFCHFIGHATEQCRKLKKKQQELEASESDKVPEVPSKAEAPTKSTQDPSPFAPRVSCYGCGTPGVVRSSCPTCCTNKQRSTQSANLSFCPINVQSDVRNTLKTRLTTAPVLRQADKTKPYTLKTDASSYALGAVLVQGEKEDDPPVENTEAMKHLRRRGRLKKERVVSTPLPGSKRGLGRPKKQ